MNGKQKWRIHRATASNSCPELSMTKEVMRYFIFHETLGNSQSKVENTEDH